MNILSHIEVTATKVVNLLALIALTVGCWLTVTLLWGSMSLGWLILFALMVWLVTSALVVGVRKMNLSPWIYVALLTLAGLSLPARWLVDIFPYSSLEAEPFTGSLALSQLILLSLALVIGALIFYQSLTLFRRWRHEPATADWTLVKNHKHTGRAAAATFILSVLLLSEALHSQYWLMIWDSTYDSLDYLWLSIPILGALSAGYLLFIAMSGKKKVVGIVYWLLVPTLLIAVSDRAKQVDFRQLTEERAAKIAHALETHYARRGRYPEELRQLIPWTKLTLTGPVIMYGQSWCYDGGPDFYRLGYVDREHWSDPRLIGRIYVTNGQAAENKPICAEEVAAIQRRFPQYPYSYWKDEMLWQNASDEAFSRDYH